MEHKHIIIRANISKPPKDVRFIKKWIKKLIIAIGMRRLGGPLAVYCGDKNNRGLTCLAILNTSHIALHTWDEQSPGVLQLDIYTCGSLDKNVIIEYIQQYEPSNISYIVLDRATELRIEKHDI